MIRRTVPRAILASMTLVPLVTGALARALLGGSAAALSPTTFALGVAAPLVVTGGLGALVCALLTRRHGLLLRDSLRYLADGASTEGLPEAMHDLPEDALGIQSAFASMRQNLDHALRQLAYADAQRRRLFADLAHELATPASALLALGDTLSDPSLPLDDAERARLFRCLEAETLRVARLVEDVRDLAELDDPDVSFVMEEVDLADVARRAVASASVRPGARIDLEASPAIVEGDADRLVQALINLLNNARRYTPIDRAIAVRVRPNIDGVEVDVSDEGPGVPAAALARLGERLFRVEAARTRAEGGHGLGLSIVRAVVERHRGTIAFTANESGGLRVAIRLPAARRSPRDRNERTEASRSS